MQGNLTLNDASVATDRKPRPGLKPVVVAGKRRFSRSRDGPKTQTGIETERLLPVVEIEHEVATDRKPRPGLKQGLINELAAGREGRDGPKTQTGIETAPPRRNAIS